MRRVQIRLPPALFAVSHGRARRQAFLDANLLKGGEPLLVVARRGVVSLLGGADFLGQERRPLAPAEKARLRKTHRERERMGLPRLIENRLGFAWRIARIR